MLSTLTLAQAGVSVWSNKVGRAQADLCLGLDLVSAASPAYLDRYAEDRTVAVLNSDVLPTGEMVRNVWAEFDASAATASIAAYARPGQT